MALKSRWLVYSLFLLLGIGGFWQWRPSAIRPASTAIATPTPVPALDSDGDGLADAMEQWLAESFAPLYVFDNHEHNFLAQRPLLELRDVNFFYQVTPVECNSQFQIGATVDAASPSTTFLLTIVATYAYDYIPLNVRRVQRNVLGHYGDTERLRICLTTTATPASIPPTPLHQAITLDGTVYQVVFVQMNRHNTIGSYLPHELEWETASRFRVYVSEGKHASYPSYQMCVANPAPHSPERLVWHENCTEHRFAFLTIQPKRLLNVGEATQPVLQDTRHVVALVGEFPPHEIFPETHEYFWQGERYCGGYQITDWNTTHSVADLRLPWCADSLVSKWWIP